MTAARKPRETKEARKERQAEEELRMVAVLKKAGNVLDKEVPILNERTGRNWRVDYIINGSVCLEIEGYGRHQSWKGWHADLYKYNYLAAIIGPLIRVTREMVANGEALEALSRCGVRVEAV